jgi:hypothetical protein
MVEASALVIMFKARKKTFFSVTLVCGTPGLGSALVAVGDFICRRASA